MLEYGKSQIGIYVIYTIICLKSVSLSVDVRRLQVAILARSPREMSQTDRILPRYFLSRVRVSVRPRIFFYTRKNSQTTVGPITDRPRHRPSERRNNLKGILYLHARWRLTSHKWLRMILLAPQNHPSLRESYPRCNDPAKRGSVCAYAGLHSQVICTCVSLKFIQITDNS